MAIKRNELQEASAVLTKILDAERISISKKLPAENSSVLLIEAIRGLDLHAYKLKDTHDPQKRVYYESVRFGWALVFCALYPNDSFIDDIPQHKSIPQNFELIDTVVQHAGAIQTAQQFLDYCRANLMGVRSDDLKSFDFFHLTSNPGIEIYERMSLEFYFSLVRGKVSESWDAVDELLPEVKRSLKRIVRSFNKDFLNYQPTEKLTHFYSEYAYLQMHSNHVTDEFDEADVFGGIEYKKYIRFTQFIFQSALMHKDCCEALVKATDGKVDFRNILIKTYSLQSYLAELSQHFQWDPDVVAAIVSGFTINKDNFKEHLAYPGANPAPFFQLGRDTLLQSTHGCMVMPIQFLSRELKRKYPGDFFNAVKNREARFKRQLYDLFVGDHIVKIYDNVDIRSKKGKTDIDGIIFDKQSKSLGLFQLKWQDTFSTSMRERFSRISNLIPVSVEWIEKVLAWVDENDNQSILRSLRLTAVDAKIEKIFLFVVSRNHVHFSNAKLDNRAIWSSWYQIVEAFAKSDTTDGFISLNKFASCVHSLSPMNRWKEDPLPKFREYEFGFAGYKFRVKPEHALREN